MLYYIDYIRASLGFHTPEGISLIGNELCKKSKGTLIKAGTSSSSVCIILVLDE
jgi:hypothetical protein